MWENQNQNLHVTKYRKIYKIYTMALNSNHPMSPLTETEEAELLQPTLERLASCLPLLELEEMLKDLSTVDVVLKHEIDILVAKLSGEDVTASQATIEEKFKPMVMSAKDMVQSFETPLDKYGLTVSALVGRLRSPLETIHPPHSSLPHHVKARKLKKSSVVNVPQKNSGNASIRGNNSSVKEGQVQQVKAILALKDNPLYTQNVSTECLLSELKKIRSHRSSQVFKKPVNEREAPGYKSKILFPVDLSLLNKMVVKGKITSFKEFHRYIGILSHNCVKFNGRESDYGLVAREFEGFVDDIIVNAVAKIANASSRNSKLIQQNQNREPPPNAKKQNNEGKAENKTDTLPKSVLLSNDVKTQHELSRTSPKIVASNGKDSKINDEVENVTNPTAIGREEDSRTNSDKVFTDNPSCVTNMKKDRVVTKNENDMRRSHNVPKEPTSLSSIEGTNLKLNKANSESFKNDDISDPHPNAHLSEKRKRSPEPDGEAAESNVSGITPNTRRSKRSR